MPTLRIIVSVWAFRLMPFAPIERTQPIVAAIARVAHDEREAAVLLVISFHETGLGRAGVPWGACALACRSRCGLCRELPLERAAAWSLRIWKLALQRTSWARPAVALQVAFSWYHHGEPSRWRTDRFAQSEARQVARLMSRAH